MDRKWRLDLRGTHTRRWLMQFLLTALIGCGGANPADVAQLTGQPPETPTVVAGTATPTSVPTPTPGQPAALRFVDAQPASIGVRGSGLPQQSTLTFQVTDAVGTPVGGVPVSFALATLADESIAPARAVTDASGNAQVTLTSGERAVSVQVTAQVDAVSPALVVRSTAVDILGGPPSALHFSLAHQFHNISGRVTFGLTDQITAFVGDRFGNPAPPGTAVSFTTSGGTIGNLVATNALGQATGTLVSQAPVSSDGIVSTLATTHGERPFVDNNVNGVCDAGDDVLAVSEPFYDSNCNGVYDPGEDFIDLNGDKQFNNDQGSGTPACTDQVVLFDSICTTFSGPTEVQLVPSASGPIPAGGSRDYTLTISDDAGNPIVGGSTVGVTVSGSRGRVLGSANFTLPDTQTLGQIIDGVNRFHFSVLDNSPDAQTAETDGVVITVTSDPGSLPAGGNGSVNVQDVVTFEAAPPPTPTVPPSPTPTTQPPAIAPNTATLAQGTGAPPSSCNGGTQTFVVTGGSPPFSIFGGGGCVSVASVPASGGSFIFTAGDIPGAYAITATDAAGRVASAGVVVQGPPTPTFSATVPPTATLPPTPTMTPTPPAAQIQLALFVNQASDNGDGTLSAVISALVTDANGAAAGDGGTVQFSLLPPIPAGVSVTSPGFTGQAPPCTLGFTVVPQPGDALSCVKYNQTHQGETVTVQALVQTPSGTLTDTQVITLPDLRPTATPTSTLTQTSTITPTPSATATPTPAAAHIQLALFVDQASSNGDGTLSTVVSALVTDADGVTVGTGAPVLFSLLPPVPAGVSVTSPGFTGQTAPPCTLSFAVVPQPGDALSCIKYDQALQGQSVTVQALVQVVPGPSLTSTQVITLPDLRPTATPTAEPTLAPFALHFVSATPISIGVRESGLPQQSVLSFRLTDALGKPVTGFPVAFSLSRVFDESLDPLQTLTDADGVASTTLTGGTRAMTVQVIAAVDSDNNGAADLFAQSTAVSIFGAPPVQNRFSIAAEKLNVPGRVLFGVQDKISAFVNDLFGNAVPPGTAVSFTSNGASVVNPTTTDANGIAAATLITEAEIPPTGIVTVLAYTRGQEAFRDNNANGVFDPGIDTLLTDNEPEPFIDFRPLPVFLAPSGPNDMGCPIAAPSWLCNNVFDSNLPFELFVDGDENGMWNTQGTAGVFDSNILVFDSIPVTFSGHLVTPVVSPTTFAIGSGGAQAFTLEVHDDLLNPLVGGSTITITATVGTVTGGSITIPDGESFNQIVDGLNRFVFVLSDTGSDPTRALVATTITVTVNSQNGSGTFILASGTIPAAMAAPAPTPG